jgi:hypothetical protein
VAAGVVAHNQLAAVVPGVLEHLLEFLAEAPVQNPRYL